MPKLQLTRSIDINAPKDKVMKVISDFKQWQPWSPWLVIEPDAKLDYAVDGSSYSWEGKYIGSGQMSIENQGERKIDFDLLFLKPWKSKAKTSFQLEDTAQGTKVSWSMDSSLPFFMFWMTKKMNVLIGMDYDRGLRMLKEYIETGQVHSKLEYLTEQTFDSCHFVGIKNSSGMQNIGEVMSKDFEQLFDVLGPTGKITDVSFAQYHKFNLVKDDVRFTSGLGVTEVPSDLPSNFYTATLPKMKLYKVRHKGKYDHLGNAWSAAQMMMRGKAFKPARRVHPFELYVTDPRQTKPEEAITDICFAMV